MISPSHKPANPKYCKTVMSATYSFVQAHRMRSLTRNFLFLLASLILLSCSKDEDDIDNNGDYAETPTTTGSKTDATGATKTYKGIFASKDAEIRGIFDLTIPGGTEDLLNLDANASATLNLSGGEQYVAKVSNDKSFDDYGKSQDVMATFDSEDFSFKFSYDANDNPVISDVVLKNRDGSIVTSEETANNDISAVTGTYKCNNCQDQDQDLEGVPLNNSERTFNMLLTTADGNTQISIQALIGSLVETQVISEQSCTTNSDYTFCVYKSGINGTNESINWSGVHRYTTEAATSKTCSTMAGNFAFTYGDFGSIEGEFNSDNQCMNKSYFVSETGSDTNTGLSPDDAWRSIDKLNTINIQPGDEVLFEGGQEFSGNFFLDANDANNSAKPVIISSYGTGRATINAGNQHGIKAYNTSGIIIDNLIVKGSGKDVNQVSGIEFYNDLSGDVKLDYIEILNSEVYGFGKEGIVIGAWNGNSGFTNVLIENNKVHDCLDKGITSYGKFSKSKSGYAHSNITVRSCEVYNISGYNKDSHSGNGIVLSDVQHSVIEHSTVYNCGFDNTTCGGPVGIWYWDADDVTIQYSEVYDMSSGSGCDGGGFDMDGGVTNGVMQYNYSHDNDGGGFMVGQFEGSRPMSDIIVRYNISQNDAKTNGGSVYLFNGEGPTDMKNITVYNNTFYITQDSRNGKAAAVKYNVWKPVINNMKFYNNILYAAAGAALIDIPDNYDGFFAGNSYHSTSEFVIKYKGTVYNSVESFRSSGNEIFAGQNTGYEGIPQLNNIGKGGIVGFGNALSSLTEYTLQSTSPVINGGIILENCGSRDFYGNTLSTSPNDIGANQTGDTSRQYKIASK